MECSDEGKPKNSHFHLHYTISMVELVAILDLECIIIIFLKCHFLLCSDDGGKSWVRSWLVTPGDYAYSCLTHVAQEDQVGLLWETSAQDCSGPSCQLVFSKMTVF